MRTAIGNTKKTPETRDVDRDDDDDRGAMGRQPSKGTMARTQLRDCDRTARHSQELYILKSPWKDKTARKRSGNNSDGTHTG